MRAGMELIHGWPLSLFQIIGAVTQHLPKPLHSSFWGQCRCQQDQTMSVASAKVKERQRFIGVLMPRNESVVKNNPSSSLLTHAWFRCASFPGQLLSASSFVWCLILLHSWPGPKHSSWEDRLWFSRKQNEYGAVFAHMCHPENQKKALAESLANTLK